MITSIKYSSDWLMQLTHTEVDNGKKVFLIFDAAQSHESSIGFLQDTRSHPDIFVHSLFSGTTEGNIPYEVSPICIELNKRNVQESSLICHFFDQNAKTMPMFNIMISQYSLSELSKHLKSYLTVMIDEREQLFRWYDPRIGQYLSEILTEDQWRVFKRPIEQWWLSKIEYDFQPRIEMVLQEVKS